MNTPNLLTVVRATLVPVFLIIMLTDFKHHFLVALILFIIASLTDWFDGKLARKNDLVTNFGKFLDPLADKMLTTAALLGFIVIGDKIPGAVWVAFITLFREFIVAGVRLSAVADGGKVIAANIWGKLKTVSQMIAIIVILFAGWLFEIGFRYAEYVNIFGVVILWIATLLTVISGFIYVKQNIEYIDFRK